MFETLHKLRTLLFLPTQLGAPLQPLAPGVAPEAGALLSEAVSSLSEMAEMLAGPVALANGGGARGRSHAAAQASRYRRQRCVGSSSARRRAVSGCASVCVCASRACKRACMCV